MSSGYSSLEEDSEDFFFTARTSFFRRAPQGKLRTGQQVSGVPVGAVAGAQSLPGNPGAAGPQLHVSLRGARGMLARKEEAIEKGLLSDPGVVPRAGACGLTGLRWAHRGGKRRKGEEAEGPLPRQMASATPPRAAGGWGAVLRAWSRPQATPHVSSVPGDALRPLAVLMAAPSISPFIGLWPLECFGGRVTARSGRRDSASPTLPVGAPLVAGWGALRETRGLVRAGAQ